MPLIPLEIPAGVYRNGTDLQSTGRWRDASLVRWGDGVMQPVGGWLERLNMAVNPLRGAISWRDLSGDRWFAAGSYDGLFVSKASNTSHDITPTTFTDGLANASVNLGYGGGFYGTGAYGVARPDIGGNIAATTWSLDTWGQNLVACSSADGKLVEWALNTATPAATISGAPTGCSGLMVTAERFLFAFGPSGNLRKVQWSGRENNTVWNPLATNEAGDIELQTVGQIMLGIKARGQALILTDHDAHTATYQGPPFVYGFERVGSSCGAISRLCAASVDAGVFWMGRRGFYQYSGGAVFEIKCDVLDYVFASLNTAQASKICAVPNSKFSEIWWFYPNISDSENSRYVAYNYKEGHWSLGVLSRTCGVDGGVFSTPIWFDATGAAYNHEIGQVAVGDAYAESGPFQLASGDNVMALTMLIPDEKTQGDAQVTFKARYYPNGDETTFGPYSMESPTDLRFSGRQVAMRVTGARSTNWRWGVPRVNAVAGGLR